MIIMLRTRLFLKINTNEIYKEKSWYKMKSMKIFTTTNTTIKTMTTTTSSTTTTNNNNDNDDEAKDLQTQLFWLLRRVVFRIWRKWKYVDS